MSKVPILGPEPNEFTFRVLRPISEASIETSMLVNYTPTDDFSRIQVVRHLPHSYEEYLLRYFSRLQLLDPLGAERAALKHLYRALQLRASA